MAAMRENGCRIKKKPADIHRGNIAVISRQWGRAYQVCIRLVDSGWQ
jgi:hypothetical protein